MANKRLRNHYFSIRLNADEVEFISRLYELSAMRSKSAMMMEALMQFAERKNINLTTNEVK